MSRYALDKWRHVAQVDVVPALEDRDKAALCELVRDQL